MVGASAIVSAFNYSLHGGGGGGEALWPWFELKRTDDDVTYDVFVVKSKHLKSIKSKSLVNSIKMYIKKT